MKISRLEIEIDCTISEGKKKKPELYILINTETPNRFQKNSDELEEIAKNQTRPNSIGDIFNGEVSQNRYNPNPRRRNQNQ